MKDWCRRTPFCAARVVHILWINIASLACADFSHCASPITRDDVYGEWGRTDVGHSSPVAARCFLRIGLCGLLGPIAPNMAVEEGLHDNISSVRNTIYF